MLNGEKSPGWWRRAREIFSVPAGRAALALALLAGGLTCFGAIYANWDMLFGDGHPAFQGSDDTGYYLWLRSGVIDGDFDFANDLANATTLQTTARDEWLAAPRTARGRVANKFPPGWAVATLPAFVVGHVVALAGGGAADGWSPPYFVAIWCYHCALAFVGLWWASRVVLRFSRPEFAAVAVFALWIASPLVYYQTARISMVHGLLFTLLAGIHHLTFKIADDATRTRRWLALGSLCGLAVLVRPTALVYLLFPAVVLGREWWRAPGKARLFRGLGVLVPVVLAALVIAGANWALHGTPRAELYPGESFDFARPKVFQVLASSHNGLFFWHPLILVGLIGAGAAWLRGAMPRSWAVTLLAIIWINASWHAWWFGSSFGNRAFEGVVLFAMAGLGWLLEHTATRPSRSGGRALAIVVAVAVVAGVVFFVLYLTQTLPRNHGLTT